MSSIPRKTFWKIGSSKRFLLNDFLSFSRIWLAFMSFFISPLLSTPDLHSFLGLSIPVFLHPSLSSHFFLPGESPSHCRNISWAAEKTPLSSQLACQHLLCLCYDLWSDFWFYKACDGDPLTFSLGFSLEANLLKVLWCEAERSVRKWMVRRSPLWVCGF